ncbi:CASP-like protein 4A3 [Rutidosis leptorrhynchoides]|uniref:CASP-like protein 4A3 n=1 Tax=Rutidosis leptorrhynchoides TaxID=125765 RepID=UPI003A996D5F
MDFLKHNHHRHHNSATSNRSISDTDSQIDEFHSPLRADSPHLSDDISSTSTAIVPVAVDKLHTPFRSPLSNNQKSPHDINIVPLAKSQSHAVTNNRPVKGAGGVSSGDDEIRRSRVPVTSIVRRSRSEGTFEKVGLGFRVCEMVLSLIAFCVMVTDKTQGWSGDSFDRYKEYRYLVAVNVIAFIYATLQVTDLTYHLVYEKHIVAFSLRILFNFLIDQILAYLLISSSSSAATRIDDWVLNWGKDDFTKRASASVVMSFLTFLSFAFSSLISGYRLCDQNPI